MFDGIKLVAKFYTVTRPALFVIDGITKYQKGDIVMPLTDIQIKTAEQKSKAFKITDGPGLYLLVNKSGKYFRYDYRFQGKRKTLAVGVYPKTSLKEARKKRQEARDLLDQGIDPIIKKKRDRVAGQLVGTESFEQLAREWFDKKKGGWSDRYSNTLMKRLELNIFPYLGDVPVNDITPPIL